MSRIIRIPAFALSLLFAVFAAACQSEEASTKSNWKAAPAFELESISGEGETFSSSWIGDPGKVAVMNNAFRAGETQKYMWLFWGEEEELVGQTFKIVANSERGDSETIFEGKLGGENFGATASSPSGLSIGSKGLWKLDAYVGDRLHGSFVVEVI
ncbi:hypothetical protein [Cohnella sp. AR92]|uniref:hypothetical protein n=1 Tax=Cohnella sp. AR92 TaxID=648716 RepID=UPI000F8E6A4E|nr:hypothetical protein [Cohnella sp. AR92]RUS46891.1 hypothetical protein ELR57_10800 [Cohnella sp. AR92]